MDTNIENETIAISFPARHPQRANAWPYPTSSEIAP